MHYQQLPRLFYTVAYGLHTMTIANHCEQATKDISLLLRATWLHHGLH